MYGTMAHIIFVNLLVSIYMFELMYQMNLLGEGCYNLYSWRKLNTAKIVPARIMYNHKDVEVAHE